MQKLLEVISKPSFRALARPARGWSPFGWDPFHKQWLK